MPLATLVPLWWQSVRATVSRRLLAALGGLVPLVAKPPPETTAITRSMTVLERIAFHCTPVDSEQWLPAFMWGLVAATVLSAALIGWLVSWRCSCQQTTKSSLPPATPLALNLSCSASEKSSSSSSSSSSHSFQGPAPDDEDDIVSLGFEEESLFAFEECLEEESPPTEQQLQEQDVQRYQKDEPQRGNLTSWVQEDSVVSTAELPAVQLLANNHRRGPLQADDRFVASSIEPDVVPAVTVSEDAESSFNLRILPMEVELRRASAESIPSTPWRLDRPVRNNDDDSLWAL